MSACVCNTFLTPQNWHRLLLCNRAPELKFPSVVSDSLCDKMAAEYTMVGCYVEEVTLPGFLFGRVCFFFRVPTAFLLTLHCIVSRSTLVDFALYCIIRLWLTLWLTEESVDISFSWNQTDLCIAPPHQLLQSFTSQNHLCNMKIMIFFKLWINWTYRDHYRQECSLQLWSSLFGLAVVSQLLPIS